MKTKIMRSLTAFLLLALPVPLCAADPSARETELTYLRTIMGEDLLPYAHLEVPAVENVMILGSGADQHLGLHVFPGQKKRNGGIRAEVSVDYPCKQGDTVRYAWRFMVPEGFKSDAPRNRWWIFGQWHDQPDKNRGESWDGFGSACIAIPRSRPTTGSTSTICRSPWRNDSHLPPRRPRIQEVSPTFPEILQDWREDVAEIKETAEARFYNSEEPLTHGELS